MVDIKGVLFQVDTLMRNGKVYAEQSLQPAVDTYNALSRDERKLHWGAAIDAPVIGQVERLAMLDDHVIGMATVDKNVWELLQEGRAQLKFCQNTGTTPHVSVEPVPCTPANKGSTAPKKKTYAIIDLEPDSPCYNKPIGMWYNQSRSYIEGVFSVLDAQYPSRKIGILCEQTKEVVETGGGRPALTTGRKPKCSICGGEAELLALPRHIYWCNNCYLSCGI